MKKGLIGLLVLISTVTMAGCANSSNGDRSNESSSSTGGSNSTNTPSLQQPRLSKTQQAYSKGFESVTIPTDMRGTWYGYEAYSNNMSTIEFGHNVVKFSGDDNDGQVRPIYNPNVRTKEDHAVLTASNGGSAAGPHYTAADTFRKDHWDAAQLSSLEGHKGLRLWNSWYISDGGAFYYVAQKKVGNKKYDVLVEPENGAIFYRDRSIFETEKEKGKHKAPVMIPTNDDFFVLSYLYSRGYSLSYAYEEIVEGGVKIALSPDGSKITVPGAKGDDGFSFPAILKLRYKDHMIFKFDRIKNKDKAARDALTEEASMAELEKEMFTGDDSLSQLQEIRIKMQQNGIEASK